jgi:hypothetical protein
MRLSLKRKRCAKTNQQSRDDRNKAAAKGMFHSWNSLVAQWATDPRSIGREVEIKMWKDWKKLAPSGTQPIRFICQHGQSNVRRLDTLARLRPLRQWPTGSGTTKQRCRHGPPSA